jgi:hypothetical protein
MLVFTAECTQFVPFAVTIAEFQALVKRRTRKYFGDSDAFGLPGFRVEQKAAGLRILGS